VTKGTCSTLERTGDIISGGSSELIMEYRDRPEKGRTHLCEKKDDF